MNPKTLVRFSNIIGVVSIVLLVYWIFIFTITQVFGFRVFQENISETFLFSIMGILALMAGSLIINIMFNLTRIAQRHNQDDEIGNDRNSKKILLLGLLSFPLIFALLFAGDYLTSKKKEKMLVATAQKLLENDVVKSDKLLNYSFSKKWINETSKYIRVLSSTEENFNGIRVIVKDQIEDTDVYLGFRRYSMMENDSSNIYKQNYIASTDQEDRDYLEKVFEQGYSKYKYKAHDSNYELFYPYIKGDKVIVLSFSDYRRYGKIGS